MKTQTFIIIIVSIIFSQHLFGQVIIPKTKNAEYYVETAYYLGFCFTTGANNSAITYAIVKEIEKTKIEAQVISFNTFMRIISGNQNSKANSKQINLLETNEINPLIFKELWKIKYGENPNFGNNEKGWASTLMSPSESQFNILKQYGIYGFTSYCYGDNMIKLLKDMQSLSWVNLYESLK